MKGFKAESTWLANLQRTVWLTYSGRFINVSGYPSAAGRAQDS